MAIKTAPGSYQVRSGRLLSSKRVQVGDGGTAAASAERGDNNNHETERERETVETDD